ncbi:MAG: ATP-binding cassette domain-containing protein [Caldilineaceae bacterium]|nr:ATP-binding cassette domain-containing protein [Caldilineaceae bacterium]
MSVLLEVRNLTKVFVTPGQTPVRAVDDVSIEIEEGSTFGLVGESGSGKSTLARLIPRLIEPTSGEILYQRRNLLAYNEKQLREVRQEIQLVFQNPYSSLNPRMSVRQLIGEPLYIHGKAAGAALDQRVLEMMELVGLKPEHANRFPHEFSGGQRQRIGIARALILHPRLLILDEPTSALDVSVQAQVLNLLIDLQQKLGLTYLLITHDLSVVHYMCDTAALLYLGTVVEKGTLAQVFRQPQHPYTQALLHDVPSADPDQRMLENISLESDIFSARWSGTGCRFAPRCPANQVGACTTIEPPLVPVGEGHMVACHLVHPHLNP